MHPTHTSRSACARNPGLWLVWALCLVLLPRGAAHGALAMTTPGDTSMATLDEVLGSPFPTDTERRDVRYHKAVLLSREGRDAEAKNIFLSIYEEAPQYRDVASRLDRGES